MRRFASIAPILCLALALVTGVFCTPAYAAHYTLYELGNDDGIFPYGLTDNGTAVTYGTCPNGEFPTSTFCYTTYGNGVEAAFAGAAPDLSFDNGVSCDPHGLTIASGTGRCNGADDVYHTQASDSFGALYAGLIGSETLVTSDLANLVLLNDAGDILFVDISKEALYEAVVTPEPSTLALLGTGCLGVAGLFRRRFGHA